MRFKRGIPQLAALQARSVPSTAAFSGIHFPLISGGGYDTEVFRSVPAQAV